MLGCKCQQICVSLALLGSTRQHLIDVSACTGPGQPPQEHFYPCLHLKETTVAQLDCMLRWLWQLNGSFLFCFTSLTQIHICRWVEFVVEADGCETVIRVLGDKLSQELWIFSNLIKKIRLDQIAT